MQTNSRRSRTLGLIAVAMMMVLGFVAAPFLASASTFSTGFTVEHTGAEIQNDLYVAAFRADITADVAGDVSLASVSANLDGSVGGSVHVLSGSATIRGDVAGSIYVVGGVARVEGTIEGNAVVVGGLLVLEDTGRIGGDLTVFGGQAQVDGVVAGKLYGSVLVYEQDGSVSGNVELQADRVRLGANAEIGDDLRYQSQTGASIHTNADIGGATERTNATPWSGVGDGGLAPYGQLMRLVWSMLAGALLIAIAPRMFYRAAEHGSQAVAAGIWGTFGLVLLPMLAIVALLSVFFIPIGLLMLALIPVLLYLSQVVVGLTIGRAILPRKWRDGSRGYLLFALVLGLIVIGVLRMAPVPFLDVVVLVLVSVWGFGALLMLARDLSSDSTRHAMHRGW